MPKLVWLTDIHLNFVSDNEVAAFLETVKNEMPDAVLVGGDIGEAHSLAKYLEQMAHAWPCRVYFVLGNHDFYHGSLAGVRQMTRELCQRYDNLVYLSDSEPIALTDHLALIGHDGWADARVGDYMRSVVMMNDYRLIDELSHLSKEERWDVLLGLGNEAAEYVQQALTKALEAYPRVLFLTHVPPLRDACWYDGKISDDEWAPHFTCMAVGHTLIDLMRIYPDRSLTVFCGHTHGEGICNPLPNITIHTGRAQYGQPAITKILDVV
ncbi:MAG: metallophosphoesterase [Pirellulaceae bacterium]|nr:metallophosphoesterase [Planctomycetales bacterium]